MNDNGYRLNIYIYIVRVSRLKTMNELNVIVGEFEKHT